MSGINNQVGQSPKDTIGKSTDASGTKHLISKLVAIIILAGILILLLPQVVSNNKSSQDYMSDSMNLRNTQVEFRVAQASISESIQKEEIFADTISYESNYLEPEKSGFYVDYELSRIPVSTELSNLTESLTDSTTELHNLGVVQHPTDTETLILSVSVTPNSGYDTKTCTNKLYTYNVKSQKLAEFYSETSTGSGLEQDGDYRHCRWLYLYATAGSKLLIVPTGPYLSLSGCADAYLFTGEMLALELSDLSAGFQQYEPSPMFKNKILKRHDYNCEQFDKAVSESEFIME